LNFYASNDEETRKIAKDFAKQLKPGDIVCMTGELGAGKTTFTKGIAEAFNSLYEPVSPTFNIVNEYPGDLTIYHFDLYRLMDSSELTEVGLQHAIQNDITLIEWPEIALGVLPNDTIHVYITELNGGRKIVVK
jgi:tRNA threonylcarbamoyl adenosine modification protein YjeE